MISSNTLHEFRLNTFCLLPGFQLKTKKDAVAFVKKRGFVFFWPIKGILLPSLWVATAGDRPVADQHDDPGHITWQWKDELLGKREWYYAKVLRKKSTMISMQIAPNFYALSENYGSPEEDYLTLYKQGRLTQEAKSIYEAILFQGPLDTISLRRAARLSSRENEARFNKALTDLQADFKITPIGVARTGGWNYAFIYEITVRHYPEILEAASNISDDQARQKLVELYFLSVGAAQERDINRLFNWRPVEIQNIINSLIENRWLVKGIIVENKPGQWLALATLAKQNEQ